MRFVLVVALLLAIGGPVGAAVPPWFPTRLGHLGDSRQVVVVAGHSRTSTYSTAYAYQRGTDGRWRAAFPAMAARNGFGGWQWATRRVQGTGTTPIGTFPITEAFGRYRAGLEERCAEPPVVTQMEEVGSYRFP